MITKIFRFGANFFSKKYWLLLLIVVLLSYGQIFFMFPWQDDHTLFFKLSNITGMAGYFGYGPIGQGPYKYIVTPYIFIYKLFGLNPVAFYIFAVFFYFLAVLVVYKVFSGIIDDKAGKMAGFIFASGYVASDGFIRIFNSVSTSVSIILVSLLFFFYWKHLRKNTLAFYFLAVLFYFLAVELARIRTHYLIAVVIAIELIFNVFGRLKARILLKSLIRLAPFIFIFYQYFFKNADSRTSQVRPFVESLLKGDFFKLYSFLSAITNIIIPNWLMDFFGKPTRPIYLYFGTILLFSIIFYVSLKDMPKRKLLSAAYILVSCIWAVTSKFFFSVPVLGLNKQEFWEVFIAGEILFLVPLFVKRLQRKWRGLAIFLFLWIVVNVLSYAVYNPTLKFVQYHRYLAHSFLPLVGFLALLSVQNKKVYGLILAWGIVNLAGSVFYQQKILTTRSLPAKNFYRELRAYVPNVKPGDLFYFDVSDGTKGYFSDAFSVASMPEETALAWQYGVDRYDIRLFTEFDDLIAALSNGYITDVDDMEIPVQDFHAFFYSRHGLKDTTTVLSERLTTKNVDTNLSITDMNMNEASELILNLEGPLISLTPNTLSLTISATPPSIDSLKSQYQSRDKKFITLAFDYLRETEKLMKNAKMAVSSTWKRDIKEQLSDGRSDTSWRADRILWSKEGAELTVDFGSSVSINRFVWQNGSASNSPTQYEILISPDGNLWQTVAEKSTQRRIEQDDLQVVSFAKVTTRFMKMRIIDTLSKDSPSISEVWVVPSRFADLDVHEAEGFLGSPLNFVGSEQDYKFILSQMSFRGKVQVSWLSDKYDSWKTQSDAYFNVDYNGVPKVYDIKIPAGGTQITQLKLGQEQIPGSLHVTNITVHSPGLENTD